MATTITSVEAGSVVALGNIPLTENVYTAGQVETRLSEVAGVLSQEIASAVSTAWKAGGSKAPTDLTSALLVAANEGKVYNMSASGTTDTNFIEGSGKPYIAGTDIAVINTGTDASPVYKFNVLATQDSSVVKSVNNITPTNGNVEIPLANSSGDGLMPYGDKNKLDSVASGANVGFDSIVIGAVTLQTTSSGKSVGIIGGGNISISGDSSNNSVTFSVLDGSTSAKGVVQLASGIGDTGAVVPTAAIVSGAISGAVSGLVNGSTLHSGLVENGLSNPSATPTSGTIYALIKALHASDNQSESAA